MIFDIKSLQFSGVECISAGYIWDILVCRSSGEAEKAEPGGFSKL